MPSTPDEVLAAAQRSLSAAGAHDRDGWIELFIADGRVEDPVGSAPHRGRAAIARFYDTFIAPRDISYELDADVVVGNTVIRDVELGISMSPSLTMRVPTFIRYDLCAVGSELKVAALSAYWELPAMVGQFTRGGLGAVPVALTLGRTMFANQGLGGSVGFLTGLRGLGSGGKAAVRRFLDDACGGDEVGMRRLVSNASVTVGDDEAMSSSELVKALSGGTWSKMVGSGRSVAARVVRDGLVSVLIAETGGMGRDGARITRLRLFPEVAPRT